MHSQTQRERFESWASAPPREWWLARADENHKYLLEGEYIDEGVQRAWEGWEAACPEGWQAVPQKITAETGHKAALIGEFFESVTMTCPECWDDEYPDQDCDICNGQGHYDQRVPVEWTTIKRIHDAIVDAAPKPEDL